MLRTLRLAGVTATLLFAVSAALAEGQIQRPEPARADHSDFVTMRGCVHGSLLTSTRLDPGTVAGAPTGSNRYRMTGSKEIRGQLKKADGKMADVTGRLRIDDQRAYVNSKKKGKTTFTIGAAGGQVTPLDQHPVADATLEVVGVEIVQPVCNAP